mgnify:CR=1 FL=1
MFQESHLAIRETASSLVQTYQHNTRRIKEGYDLLIEADQTQNRVFSAYRPGGFHRSYVHEKEKTLKEFRVQAWRFIVNSLGIYNLMSLKRQNEFDENCTEGNLPEISRETVFAFLDDVMNGASEIVAETVREVYDYLRPGARAYNKHKTNTKNARWYLGEKVVLTSVLDVNGHAWTTEYSMNIWRRDYLIQIDRVMHLLDGAGIPDGYLSPLVDAIQTTPYYSGASGETDYFSFKCYFNGNLHLTFKRLDLVDRLNATALGEKILGDEEHA